MNTFENRFRNAAAEASSRVEFDKICSALTSDLIATSLEVNRVGKVLGEDAIEFNVTAYIPGVGDELEKVIEKGTSIKRYFCFDGEREDTVEAPLLADFREQIAESVSEWAFDLF